MTFYTNFEHNLTDAQQPHQTLNLNDVHINLGQKVTTTEYVNNIKLQPKFFLRKAETIQLNGSGLRYLRRQILDVKLFEIDIIGGTIHVDYLCFSLPNKNVKNAIVIYCGIWCTLALLYPPKPNLRLTSRFCTTFQKRKDKWYKICQGITT